MARTKLDETLKRGKERLFATVVRPLQAFLHVQAASGILLLGAALAAIVWANVHPQSYRAAWDYPLALGAGATVAHFTLRIFINDGLMALFFFVVGMEIKRELVTGELNSAAKASLPAIAALGGMILPAAIYIAFNGNGPGRGGWGIPMATDIAFCVGILAILEDRVPRSLVAFLTALAIFDDIGGILVIAIFYGHGLSPGWLIAAAGISAVLFVMSRAGVTSRFGYGVLGIALWYAIHHGGVHATISGVVLGLMIPATPLRPPREVLEELDDHVSALRRKPQDQELAGAEILAIEERLEGLQSPVEGFLHGLHPFVAFIIMPIFALANSGVTLGGGAGLAGLLAPVGLGTASGLFLGKLAGIFAATMLAVRLGLSPMPAGATRRAVFGVSVLAGIGFTVALFIAALAFENEPALLAQAKMGILAASLAAGLCGFAILRLGARMGAPDG